MSDHISPRVHSLQWLAMSLGVTARALRGLTQPGPLLGLWPRLLLPLPHSALATQYSRRAPPSGCLPFSLPGMLFPGIHVAHAHPSSHDASLDHATKNCHTSPPHTPFPSFCASFLFTEFITGQCYIIYWFVLLSALSPCSVNFIKVRILYLFYLMIRLEYP